jgi:hypothetical protein
MIKDLIKVASEFDKLGLIKEANLIDLLIKKVSSGNTEVTLKDIGMDKLKTYSDDYRDGITYHELGAVVILGRDNPGLFDGDRLNPLSKYLTQDGREITGTIKSLIENKKAIVVLPDNALKRTPLKEEFRPSSNIISLQKEVPNEMMVEEGSEPISDERERDIAERAEDINEMSPRFRNQNAQEIKDVRDAKSAEEEEMRSKFYPGWTNQDFDNLLGRIDYSQDLF